MSIRVHPWLIFVVFCASVVIIREECSTTKAAPEEVGHLDEEGAAVATEARLQLSGEGIETVANQIVVVTNIERCARIRRPAQKELPSGSRRKRVIVDSSAKKDEARKLIRCAKRIDVVIESNQLSVFPSQPILVVIKGHAQRIRRLI